MSEAFEKIRDALESHGSKTVTRSSKQLMAQCPVHEDKEPSVSVSDAGDRVLIRCHAGCHTDEIVDTLGLTLADLFDEDLSLVPRENAVVVRSYLYETALGKPWFYKDRYAPKTFIQRLPGTEPGDKRGLQGRPPVLYHLPALIRGIRAGLPVYLVEGEKDVESCERHGLVATTTPGGAAASWQPEFTDCLREASEVRIIADQDPKKDDGTLGAGHQFANNARTALRAAGIKVTVLAPASGKDATDHFEAGRTVDEFRRDTALVIRPRGMTGDRLMETDFPELRYAIEDVLPEGLAILAGSPKAGKSWTALQFGLGVAAGGFAMGALRCSRGNVLYLAREDGYRRIQSRLDLLMTGDEGEYLRNFEVIPTEVPWAGGEQGLAAMTEWAEEVDNPLLVVLDTLAKVEPATDERNDRYKADYAMMAAYKTWADTHHATVLAVHHDRKAASEDGDPFSKISGTRGVTGAADTMMFLQSQRGTGEGVLHITGRDVAEQALELRKAGPVWQVTSLVEQIHKRRAS